MKALCDLQPAELARRIGNVDKEYSAVLDALIKAGRGNETPRDTMRLRDPLSQRFIDVATRWQALRAEQARRMEYHGSTRRIVRTL